MTNKPPSPGKLLWIWFCLGLSATLIGGLLNPSAGEFILTSIVCTAFMSLVIWIPVWIMIGGLIYLVYRGLFTLFQRRA